MNLEFVIDRGQESGRAGAPPVAPAKDGYRPAVFVVVKDETWSMSFCVFLDRDKARQIIDALEPFVEQCDD